MLEHVAAVGVVEADVPELHGAGLGGFGDAALQYAGLGGENLVYTSGGDLCGGQEHDYDDKHHYAHYDVGGVGAEYDDIAEAFKPSGHILGGYGVYYGRAHPVYDQRQGVHAQGHNGHQEAKVRWLKSCVRIRAEFDFSNLAFW